MSLVTDLRHPLTCNRNAMLAVEVSYALVLLPEPGCRAPDANLGIYYLVNVLAHANVTVVRHLHDVGLQIIAVSCKQLLACTGSHVSEEENVVDPSVFEDEESYEEEEEYEEEEASYDEDEESYEEDEDEDEDEEEEPKRRWKFTMPQINLPKISLPKISTPKFLI